MTHGGSFLSLIPGIAAGFPLKNAVPCVARTFLYGHEGRSDRPCLCVAKLQFYSLTSKFTYMPFHQIDDFVGGEL